MCIRDSYNTRQDQFEDRVVRGSILSSDGQTLAYTQVNDCLLYTSYSGSEALRAVKQVDVTSHMNVEEILKLALKKMNF